MDVLNVKEQTYRKLFIIPLLLLSFSLIVLANAYLHGDILERDIDLKGGVQISMAYSTPVDAYSFERQLTEKGIPDVRVRTTSDFSGEQTGLQIEAGVDNPDEFESAVESIIGMELTDENRSITNFGSTLAESFWKQARKAILWAVFLMCTIIVIAFRKPVLFGAILLNVFADIVTTLAFMNLFSIQLSLASIAALLMILGTGVDSNILLSTRAYRQRGGEMVSRINEALLTGLVMSAAILLVLLSILFFARAPALTTITSVLFIGMSVDTLYTWIMNVNILLRWGKK
ncbi:MAG: MMPL family transporter [archaeon]